MTDGLNNKSYTIIGQQTADALEKERQREAENPGPSPLPKYSYNHRELWLLEPQDTQLDIDLRVLCNQLPQLTSAQQNDLRHRISHKEFYTLITFAERSAVLAIRHQDSDILRAGLRAIALIEADRIDYRDIGTPMGPLYYAAMKIGLDPKAEIANAADLSEPKVRDTFLALLKRLRNKEFNLYSESLLEEVDTPSGLGFVRRYFEKYQPKINLLNIALDIVKLIETDKYHSECPEMGWKIPEVWFGNTVSVIKKDLDTVSGTIKIKVNLGDQYGEKAWGQMFVVWLSETKNTQTANHLLEIARSIQPKSYCLLTMAEGKLFCLIVARSWVMNLESFEKGDSLHRFETGIHEALIKGLNTTT